MRFQLSALTLVEVLHILYGPVENVPRRINDLSVNLAVTHVLKAIATVESSDTLCTQTLDNKTKEFFIWKP